MAGRPASGHSRSEHGNPSETRPVRNRGAASNPASRFLPLAYEVDPETLEADRLDPEVDAEPRPRTQFLSDTSRTVISYNSSPDVGFSASVNPYRGCEHGCIYCYARPTHEYLGFSAGLDFETRVLVKENAPELLRRELAAPKWTPQPLALSGVTDPYQPIEGKLRLTRRVLEVLAEFRNPVVIVTKNHLVRRDIDLLSGLAAQKLCAVFLSITTLRPELHRQLEPRTCQPARRLEAIRELSHAGIPVGVLVAPVIPALNDHEIASILKRSADAGARHAGYIVLRLPHTVRPLFEEWLGHHYPDRKVKILSRIRSLRDGKLNDTRFQKRMRGEGIFAEQIARLFDLGCLSAGLSRARLELTTKLFRPPGGRQLSFFDEIE